MTIPFNIGDEIEFVIKGKIEEYSVSKHGDCYTIRIEDLDKHASGTRVYLDSNTLFKAVIRKGE